MNGSIIAINQEIIIDGPPALLPIRFRFPEEGPLTSQASRREIALICESLCRLAKGERRQGIIDVAVALGLEVYE